MAFQLTMNMTYAGREPQVLSDLILRRQKVLGETAQQAVIGTGITVMQSLRAQTIIADENKFELRRSAAAYARWVTVNKKHRLKVEGISEGRKYINLAGLHSRGNIYNVYEATVYKQGKPDTLYFIAKDEKPVKGYLQRRIRRYKRMARSAWGHLMRMTSQREADTEPMSTAATNVLRKNLSVVSGGNQYDFAMQITDDLVYAASALKGGPASVTYAMQAASNKVAGRIRRFIADHPSLSDQNIQTPFPEIRKAR